MDVKEMNLFEKMLCITSELPIVNKNLEVSASASRSYKAVSERDVLDAVKALESKYRVYSYPVDRILMELPIPEGKTGQWIRVETTYRFLNIDKPDQFIDIKSYGDGIDSMDKAPGKAMTYADKYALMKAYKISTGDDPDQEASEMLDAKVNQTVKMASENQIKYIKGLMPEDRFQKMLEYYKLSSESEITAQVADEVIKKLKKKAQTN